TPARARAWSTGSRRSRSSSRGRARAARPRSAPYRPPASRSSASRTSLRKLTTGCGPRRGGGSDDRPLSRVSHPPGRCKAHTGCVLSRVRSFQLRTLPASLPERLFAAGGHEPHGRWPLMARDTGPKCRICRREGMKLFLKGERCLTEKCAIERRSYPPGEHGRGRIKQSEYLLQLREKQKARRYYGLLEKQFRTYYEKASRRSGVTGEVLKQPERAEIDTPVQESLIVELYSK